MSRTVTLIVVDSSGAVLGALPPFDVSLPWWPEVTEPLEIARRKYGVTAQVLRLLDADRPAMPGGSVRYVAEATAPVPAGVLTPVRAGTVAKAMAMDARRAPYAAPGGPAETVQWALETLAALGRTGFTATQIKSWNLSAIWRLDPDVGEAVWLKHVPHFFAHEAAVMQWLIAAGFGDRIPAVLAASGGRALIATAPGEDLFGAPTPTVARIGELFHPMQAATAPAVTELLDLGVPDRRGPALIAFIEKAVGERISTSYPRLLPLIEGLSKRQAEIAACGLPDALVHGDLHSGNVRGIADVRTDGSYKFLDWGDSTIGNPATDILRLTGQLEPAVADTLIDAWAARWQASVPGCEPRRALELTTPIVAVCNASTYAQFLLNIEESEHPYHALDVDDWLEKAVAGLG